MRRTQDFGVPAQDIASSWDCFESDDVYWSLSKGNGIGMLLWDSRVDETHFGYQCQDLIGWELKVELGLLSWSSCVWMLKVSIKTNFSALLGKHTAAKGEL